jgi:nitroreductase
MAVQAMWHGACTFQQLERSAMRTATSTTISLTDAITGRRSIRKFTDAPVGEASIRALLDAAVQAPTAMHAEPWAFVVIQDREALRRYSDVAKAAILQQTAVYSDLHDPAPAPKNGGFLKALGQPDFNVFYNAGTLILIGARTAAPFAEADCWLAAENLMLTAYSMGLATCCIGCSLPAFASPDIKAELAIPADVTIVAAIIVGEAAELPVSTGRKPPVILSWKKPAR